MHRDEVSSPEARKDFDEAINRILSMALLHQQMYMEKELSRFNLEEYITILVRDIIASYRSSNQMIETEIKVQKAPMKLESIVPLGLLINELVANSLKHAFNGQSTGKLTLVLKKAEGGISLTYSDDGTWVDSDLMNKGFGSELVEMLTEQLNGKLMRNGSTYELIIYT
jgi:two-component sensor histidine kinase